MNVTADIDARPSPPFLIRHWRIALLAALLVGLNLGGGWLAAQLNFHIWPRHNDMIEVIVFAIILAYVLTMMLPFVPGIEIGLAIMLFLGPGGIVLVYLCTQISLAPSFLIGRVVPRTALQSILRVMRFERASRLLEELNDPIAFQRRQRLSNRLQSRWLAVLLRNRYIALAVLLNLPGNAVIGGAGGIGAVAGASRLYGFSRYMLAVVLATTPVPAFLLLVGYS